jgi:3'-5' exoribonuclease
MSKSRTYPIVKLGDMELGQSADCFVQLVEKKRNTTREGKPFVTCRYRDSRRNVGAIPIWGDAPLFEESQRWQVGQFFKVRARLTEHDRYGLQLEIEQIRPVEDRDRDEGFAELDFLVHSRLDTERMFADLYAFAEAEIADAPLRSLVQKLLTDHAGILKRLPGSVRHYYPFAGGWLEHTLNVVGACATLTDRYAKQFPELKPPLNRDLVLASAVLHDIGRVHDIQLNAPGLPAERGVAGELFGHLYLAFDMIRAAAREIPDINQQLVDLVLHVVISHPQAPEWGSPRRSCIPEVLILHYADELDARFEMYARHLANDQTDGPFTDQTDGPFTERDPILNRVLLKEREV